MSTTPSNQILLYFSLPLDDLKKQRDVAQQEVQFLQQQVQDQRQNMRDLDQKRMEKQNEMDNTNKNESEKRKKLEIEVKEMGEQITQDWARWADSKQMCTVKEGVLELAEKLVAMAEDEFRRSGKLPEETFLEKHFRMRDSVKSNPVQLESRPKSNETDLISKILWNRGEKSSESGGEKTKQSEKTFKVPKLPKAKLQNGQPGIFVEPKEAKPKLGNLKSEDIQSFGAAKIGNGGHGTVFKPAKASKNDSTLKHSDPEETKGSVARSPESKKTKDPYPSTTSKAQEKIVPKISFGMKKNTLLQKSAAIFRDSFDGTDGDLSRPMSSSGLKPISSFSSAKAKKLEERGLKRQKLQHAKTSLETPKSQTKSTPPEVQKKGSTDLFMTIEAALSQIGTSSGNKQTNVAPKRTNMTPNTTPKSSKMTRTTTPKSTPPPAKKKKIAAVPKPKYTIEQYLLQRESYAMEERLKQKSIGKDFDAKNILVANFEDYSIPKKKSSGSQAGAS